MPDQKSIIIPASCNRLRLDKSLTELVPELSRSRIQSLIADGNLSRNGVTITDSSRSVKSGECYELVIPDVIPSHHVATSIPLVIIYEDDDILVIDKAAGMTVHPGAGNHSDTLVNALLAYCGKTLSGVGGVARPGIVHRLDKETSGLLVVAKHDEAHHHLSDQLKNRSCKRRYRAFVWGVIDPMEGNIHTQIDRSQRNRKKMAVVKVGGRNATTHYHIDETFGKQMASSVICHLETGRTHQIRVHLTHLGHGIIGDKLYGSPHKRLVNQLTEESKEYLTGFPRQALHAEALSFIHPTTNEVMEFSSALPSDLENLYQQLLILPRED